MFVVQESVALSTAQEEDDLGKIMMSYMIIGVNGVAAAAYPAYKFFNAWAESGEVDMAVVKASLSRAMTCILGTTLAGHLAATCGILVTAQKKVESAKAEADRMKNELTGIMLRDETLAGALGKARDAKDMLHESKEIYDEASDLCQEAQASKASAKYFDDGQGVSAGGQQIQTGFDNDGDLMETGTQEEGASLPNRHEEIEGSQLEDPTPGIEASCSADVVVVDDHLPGTLRHQTLFPSLAPVAGGAMMSAQHLKPSSVPFGQTIYRLSPESRSAAVGHNASPIPGSLSTAAITGAQMVTRDPVAPSRFAERHSEVYLPSWKTSTDDVIGARRPSPPPRMPRPKE